MLATQIHISICSPFEKIAPRLEVGSRFTLLVAKGGCSLFVYVVSIYMLRAHEFHRGPTPLLRRGS